MMCMQNKMQIVDVFRLLDKQLDLGVRGLLKVAEISETAHICEAVIDRLIVPDSEMARIYERDYKSKTWWTSVSKNGFAVRSDLLRLQALRSFVEGWSDGNLKDEAEEIIIQKGDLYLARRIIRQIFNQVFNKIDIVDSYFGIEVLDLLDQILSDNRAVNINIFTSKAVIHKISLDFDIFADKYPNAQIREIRDYHDRFVVIDDVAVYHFGYSLKDLGKKLSRVSVIKSPDQLSQFVEQIRALSLLKSDKIH